MGPTWCRVPTLQCDVILWSICSREEGPQQNSFLFYRYDGAGTAGILTPGEGFSHVKPNVLNNVGKWWRDSPYLDHCWGVGG